jgi:hypothetical protein
MKLIRILTALALLTLLALPVLADGQKKAVGQACDKEMTTILSMTYSGIREPRIEIIDNETDWCDFWNEAYRIMFPQPPCDLDSIDFDTEVAVVVAIGSRPTSGYGAGVSCIQKLGESGNIRVHAVEGVPDEGCALLPVVVNPVKVVKVDRPVKNAKFRKEIVVFPCP